jgi:hypothetical protein
MSRASVVVVAALLCATAIASADSLDQSVHQLGSSSSYKIRLAAALALSRSHDARAVLALGDALGNDADPTIRRVSALALEKIVDGQTAIDARELALDALDKAATGDSDQNVRSTAAKALKTLAGLRHRGGASHTPAGKAPPIFVNVDQAQDQSRKLSGDAADRLTKIVRKSVERTGYATSWPGGLPTQADITIGHSKAFIVASTVKKLDFRKSASQTEIACTVSIRIAPWGGTDGGERWEANKAASASGSAKATTGSNDRDIAGGVRDCIEAVAEDLSTRQVVPFLKHLATTP